MLPSLHRHDCPRWLFARVLRFKMLQISRSARRRCRKHPDAFSGYRRRRRGGLYHSGPPAACGNPPAMVRGYRDRWQTPSRSARRRGPVQGTRLLYFRHRSEGNRPTGTVWEICAASLSRPSPKSTTGVPSMALSSRVDPGHAAVGARPPSFSRNRPEAFARRGVWDATSTGTAVTRAAFRARASIAVASSALRVPPIM